MKELTVALPGRAYQIKVDHGCLDRVGAECRGVLPKARRIALVTDSTVGPLYAGRVVKSLEEAGFTVRVFTVPAGEASKCMARLEELYEGFMAFGLTRTDAVAALGGGVVGDLAGFAAATILRGVDFVQIPTTLLAQVDSSVGGKVAVDLKAGKNLAGAFWQPKLVLMDPETLSTLPDETFSDGMAEVIKYGCIRDREFFDLLDWCADRAGVMARIDEVVTTCCAIKAAVVLADERDTGERMLLNFGHTLGHAYELAYHYTGYTHGQAVAAGMCRAADIGVSLGVTAGDVPEAVTALVRKFGLPDAIPCTMADYKAAVGLDKKGAGSRLSLILLRTIGQGVIVPLDREEVLAQIAPFARG